MSINETYRVVSAFRDRRGKLVPPGEIYTPTSLASAERLKKAGCLVEGSEETGSVPDPDPDDAAEVPKQVPLEALKAKELREMLDHYKVDYPKRAKHAELVELARGIQVTSGDAGSE